MSSITTIALLLATNTANAERQDVKPWEYGNYMGSIGSVNIEGESAETPIYRYNNTGTSVYISIKTSKEAEEEWFFNLSSTSHIISVSPKFAKKNKLEIKTTNKRLIPYPTDYKIGGELKYVQIPELHIGNLVLKNVTAYVSSSKGSFGKRNANLQLGMGAIPQLAYAVQNSKGSVTFVSADKGAKLVTDLQGTKHNYQVSKWARVKHGIQKKIAPASSLILKTTVDKRELRSTLDIGSPESSVGWGLAPSKIQKHYGDKQSDWYPVKWGDNEATEGWLSRNAVYAAGVHEYKGKIGANILSRYDFAVNPQTFTVSLKKITEHQWKNANKAEIPHYKKQTAPKKEGEEEKASNWSTLGKKQLSVLDYKQAIKSFKKATVLESESCLNWQTLGEAQLKDGDFENAEKSFERASGLYHAWWDIDLDSRMEIKKQQGEMEKAAKKAAKEAAKEAMATGKKQKKVSWHFQQNYRCFRADGLIAQTKIAQGNLDHVEKLYREKLDLDPGLAIAFGNSSLLQGDLEKANEAYRKAYILEAKPDPLHRVGLGLYFADKGEWKYAEPLLKEALELDRHDPLVTYLWLDNARAASTSTKANILRAKRWRFKNPDSAAAQVAFLREAKIAGDQELFNKTLTEIDKFFSTRLGWLTPDSKLIGPYIQYLVMKDRLEDAEASLSKYASMSSAPEMLIAQADLKAAKGDLPGAQTILKNAGSLSADHPAYVTFLKSN